jgi:hypothetical protein
MALNRPDVFCARPRICVIVREADQLEGAGAGSVYMYSVFAQLIDSVRLANCLSRSW